MNPRKWGNFFDFRAAYVQPPQAAAMMPPVRITLPDGTAVTTGHGDLEQVLSRVQLDQPIAVPVSPRRRCSGRRDEIALQAGPAQP